MERPLILIGGGGHCKSVIEACRSCGRKVFGVMDIPEKIGQFVLDVPIIATEDDIPKYVSDVEFLVTVGFIKDSTVRNRIYHNILRNGGTLATVIASSAHVSPYAEIGHGTVILHGACVNAASKVGDNVIINTLSNIDHDVVVSDNCHISTCASLNGMVFVGHDSFIGSQAVICQCVRVCDHVVVGAGSVVTKYLTQPGVYVGAPVRKIDECGGCNI